MHVLSAKHFCDFFKILFWAVQRSVRDSFLIQFCMYSLQTTCKLQWPCLRRCSKRNKVEGFRIYWVIEGWLWKSINGSTACWYVMLLNNFSSAPRPSLSYILAYNARQASLWWACMDNSSAISPNEWRIHQQCYLTQHPSYQETSISLAEDWYTSCSC